MSTAWNLKETDGIHILELDQPDTEVNVLSSQNLTELKAVLAELSQKNDVQALLITSAKSRIFIAGADINEIEKIHSEQDAFEKAEEGKIVFQTLEDLPFPTIAVINGACLGGGYELSLSCTYCVAAMSENVKIGLPEVNLGILPGFGGSIRLPRRVGLLQALPLILAGKILSADEAFKKGLVDRLFPQRTLLDDAIVFAKTLKGKSRRSSRKKGGFLENTAPGRMLVFSQARKDVMKRSKGFYPAPLKIIELIQKTYGKTGLGVYKLESEYFSKLGATQVSKNLIKLFFMNEKYKKLKWTASKVKTQPVKKCGVVGAGVMGGGIAQRVSYKNIPVRVKDINEKALGGALKEASKIYQGAVKRKRMKKYAMEFKMGLISVGLTNAGLKNSDIVIEAVVENMEIKKKVFAELSAFMPETAVLASNTSSLSVTEMAKVSKSPERVVGLHFFNPVDRMPLVEVIRGDQTSDDTVEKTIQFARTLGKTVIVTKDAPGFLVNRLLLPYMNEAAYLLQEGMPADKIDQIATTFGMPMGPIELTDQVGIDVGYKVAHILQDAFGERMKVAGVLEDVYKKGLLGKKSGKGFYIYQGKDKQVNRQAVTGGTSATSEADAIKRMIYMMVNEAARCLDEKVIDSPATVDIGMIFGTGFPPFRAGLLHYADSIGTAKIVEDLKRFQRTVNQDRFEVSAYLQKLADTGKTFYS